MALTNRLGDFFLFCMFFIFVFLHVGFSGAVFFGYFVFFFFIRRFTKRAQFPFRSWLPKAMRAPTPVRALVHRRTLVTAGLILLLNFNFFLLSSFLVGFLVSFGLLTIFLARTMSLIEQDMKKVVALRTLSQMGMGVLVLGLGLFFFCLFHLARHAFYKSCLFMQVGFFIYVSLGNQDGRGFSGLLLLSGYTHLQLLVTLFCLCGLFFFRGIVTKDIVLEFGHSFSFSLLFMGLFFFSIFMTFFYRIRL